MPDLSGAEGRAAPQGVAEHEGNGNTGADRHHEEGGSPASRTEESLGQARGSPVVHEGRGNARRFLDSAGELNATQLQVRRVHDGSVVLINEAGANQSDTHQSRMGMSQPGADVAHLLGHGLAPCGFTPLREDRADLVDDHPLDGGAADIDTREYRPICPLDGTHGTTT